MLKIGDTGVSKLYLGDTEIKKAYVGDTLVLNLSEGSISATLGKQWTEETNLPLPTYAETYNNVAFGNGVFIAGMTRSKSANGVLRSTDGKTWKNQSGFGSTAQPTYVFYANDKFFCSQKYGTTKYSVDGITWTNVTIGSITSGYYWEIYGGGGKYIASDTGGANIYYSSDGITWTKGTSPRQFYHVGYGGGIFLALGLSGRAYTSVDGAEWTAAGTGTNSATSIFYHNGEFYTCETSVSRTKKYNPKTGVWTDISGIFSNSSVVNSTLYGFTGNEDIIVLLRGKSAHSSRDGGATWDAVAFSTTREWTNPVFGKNMVVALNTNATLKISIYSE